MQTYRRVADVENRGHHVHLHYGSLAELVRDAAGTTRGGMRPDTSSRASREFSPRGDHRGTTTWEEALALARDGWPEGAKRIVQLSDRLQDKLQTAMAERPGLELTEQGEELDVAAWLGGSPEPWWTWTDEGGRSPVVSLGMNGAMNAHTSADAFTTRGAMLLAVADALEATGRRVALTMTWASDGEGWQTRTDVSVTLKRPDEQLDLQALVFATANAAMFRRLVFSLRELLPKAMREGMRVPGSYGRSSDNAERVQGLDGERPDVVIPSGTYLRSADQAYDHALEVLRECGVDIDE